MKQNKKERRSLGQKKQAKIVGGTEVFPVFLPPSLSGNAGNAGNAGGASSITYWEGD